MSSKYSKKYLIPPDFTEILHDFGKEVVRHQPKDILDFARKNQIRINQFKS